MQTWEMKLSEYQFGDMSYSGGQPSEDQDPGYGAGQQQSPKWFREAMEKMAEQNRNLGSQVQSLLAEKRQAEVANAFEARGYARSAAALYTGEPDKMDEWLTAHGGALARSGEQPPQDTRPPGEVPPQQPAVPVVPPSVQADFQKMQQMGQSASAAPQGTSDDELAAALRATTNPEEFFQVAQAHGWQYSRENMGIA